MADTDSVKLTGQPKSKQPKVEPTVAGQQLPSKSAASTSAEEEKKRPNTRGHAANVKATAQAENDAIEIFNRRPMVQRGDPKLRPIAYAWPNPTKHSYDNMPSLLIDGSLGFRMSFVYSKDHKKSDHFGQDPVMPCQVFQRELTTHVAYFYCERDDKDGTRVVCANRPCRVGGVFERSGKFNRIWSYKSGFKGTHKCNENFTVKTLTE